MAQFEEFDYSVLNEQKAEYIFSESKEFLKGTIDAIDGIQAKTILLLGALLAIMSSVAGYLLVRIDAFPFQDGKDISIFLTGMLILLPLAYSFLLLGRNIFPKELFCSGNQPVNFLREDFCSQDFYLMVLGECKNYEEKISRNLALNERAAERLKRGALMIISTITAAPFVAAAIFLVYSGCFL